MKSSRWLTTIISVITIVGLWTIYTMKEAQVDTVDKPYGLAIWAFVSVVVGATLFFMVRRPFLGAAVAIGVLFFYLLLNPVIQY
jgi:hypothetical protein